MAFVYFPVEVISASILTRPFISQGAAILLGQDTLPGILTILGLAIITSGILVSSYGMKQKAVMEVMKD